MLKEGDELRTSAVSLEEVFLQLTGGQAAQPSEVTPAKEPA